MKIYFISIAVLLPYISLSQNLLANGGFEDENICTEFHVNCSPEAWVSTSDALSNFFKIQGLAFKGRHCVAIDAGQSKKQFHRSYIRTQLLCGLRKGSTYEVKMHIKSAHDILDSIGIYFTSYDFLFEKQILYRITPSIYVVNGRTHISHNDTGWQEVTLDYVANGDENYLTLGNFSKRDITGVTGERMVNDYLVYFDDVSMIPEDPNEKICGDWQATRDEIYTFDERHQYLDIYVQHYIQNPPNPPRLTKTSREIIDTMVLSDILFEVNKSTLRANSVTILDSIHTSLWQVGVDSIVIEGSTDSTGPQEYNLHLSTERAASVAQYFQKDLRFKRRLIICRGLASSKPVADNNTASGRAQNRRVEIFIYIRE